jgi:uncharacterized protein (TIGR03085 family)
MSDPADGVNGGASGGGSTPLDARERAELCDLFDELGPDAPTMCEGWSTADLAAHLVVRERDPRSMPGIIKPDGRFGRTTEALMQKEKARGYGVVVQRVRTGPPAVPWRIPKVRTLLNLNEYVVHHEDVRRANGRPPRTDRPDLDEAIWGMLRRGAKVLTRRVDAPLVLQRGPENREDGEDGEIVARKGTAPAVLRGEPVELLLYLMGRRGAAQVELSGPPAAIDAVEAAQFGI